MFLIIWINILIRSRRRECVSLPGASASGHAVRAACQRTTTFFWRNFQSLSQRASGRKFLFKIFYQKISGFENPKPLWVVPLLTLQIASSRIEFPLEILVGKFLEFKYSFALPALNHWLCFHGIRGRVCWLEFVRMIIQSCHYHLLETKKVI